MKLGFYIKSSVFNGRKLYQLRFMGFYLFEWSYNAPKYGAKIFLHRSWLTRQVDEQMRKRAYGLD